VRRIRLIGAILATILAFSFLTTLSTASAATAVNPTTDFVAFGFNGLSANGEVEGTITWFNRTANITGDVFIGEFATTTTAVFEAFAGSTKIESQTRTVNLTTFPNGDRHFNFLIGDTNLVGGINRVKVTISNEGLNGDSVNVDKP
jgi:hypothetical protein